MGENGAGKSTLIKILAGVVAPTARRSRIDGVEVRLDSPQAAFAHGLRFIHQELNVVPQLSVAENMFLGQPYPRRLGALVDWKSINRGAREALARLQIIDIDPRRKMARLSTGDQMLVRIASTLVSDGGSAASIFVMDEPTAALTGEESERLFAVIRELRASGCGHPLRLAPHGRGDADLRPRHRHARRPHHHDERHRRYGQETRSSG